ncbi:MAG: TolC family protein, partial [Prevotella sp.]
MRIKELLAISMLTVSITAMAQTGKGGTWTLDDCLDYAIKNNISLQKQQLSRLSAVEDIKQSQKALLPSLSANTSQMFGWRPWINDQTTTVANGTITNKISKTYYNGSYGVNANWTVWNGNKNHNTVKLNKLTEQKAELDSATTALQLKEQIASLYVQILYLTEAIGVSRQSLETSIKNEERGKTMMDVGKMSKADLAQLTAQRAQDEYNLVNAQSQIANAKKELKQLLELTNVESFEIFIPNDIEQANDQKALETIPALAEIYQAAVTTRPEIASAQLAIKSSDVSLAIAKAGKMPTIGINGSLGTSSSSMSDRAWGQQMKTNFDAGVGVSLSVPIFDGRQTKTAVNKAVIQRRQAELDLQNNEKQLWSTIEGYWIDATTNQQKFRSAVASVESQQASYDLLSEQFSLGLKNI